MPIEFTWLNFYRRVLIKKMANLMPTPPQHVLHDQNRWWERKSACLRFTGMSIGHHVVIDEDFFVLTLCEENLTIGAHSAIGQRFSCFAFNKVSVGKFCMFAANVTLTNGGHDKNSLIPFSGPLTIGNGCWIGNGAHICGPISVGDNAIISAGALVLQDVPSSAIVAGVPAKVIGYRVLPDKVWHLGNLWFSPHKFELID